VVQALMAADASAARMPISEGMATPLHFVNAATSLEVVAALLRAHPGAAAEKDNTSYLPLHDAVRSGASAAVVAAILAANPAAAAQPNNDGHLPLHWVGAMTPAGVVALVVEAHPEGAWAEDHQKDLPLHMAVFRGASPEVVAALLAAHPEAAWAQDVLGETPLGAVGSTTPPGVVQLLLAAAPETAEKANAEGDLPLHTAITRCANADALSALLSANSGAAALRNNESRLRTEHLLSQGRASAEELARRLCCGRVLPESRVAAAQLLIGPAAEATSKVISGAMVRARPFIKLTAALLRAGGRAFCRPNN
jgi:ankyrin repeat protein